MNRIYLTVVVRVNSIKIRY